MTSGLARNDQKGSHSVFRSTPPLEYKTRAQLSELWFEMIDRYEWECGQSLQHSMLKQLRLLRLDGDCAYVYDPWSGSDQHERAYLKGAIRRLLNEHGLPSPVNEVRFLFEGEPLGFSSEMKMIALTFAASEGRFFSSVESDEALNSLVRAASRWLSSLSCEPKNVVLFNASSFYNQKNGSQRIRWRDAVNHELNSAGYIILSDEIEYTWARSDVSNALKTVRNYAKRHDIPILVTSAKDMESFLIDVPEMRSFLAIEPEYFDISDGWSERNLQMVATREPGSPSGAGGDLSIRLPDLIAHPSPDEIVGVASFAMNVKEAKLLCISGEDVTYRAITAYCAFRLGYCEMTSLAEHMRCETLGQLELEIGELQDRLLQRNEIKQLVKVVMRELTELFLVPSCDEDDVTDQLPAQPQGDNVFELRPAGQHARLSKTGAHSFEAFLDEM